MLYQITPANQAKYQTHSPNHALVLKKGDQVHVADLAGIYAMGGGAGIYGLGWNVITVNHWVASTKATAIVLEGGANAITLSANGNVTGKWNAVHIGNGAGSHKNVVTNNGKIGADHGSGILLQGSENKIVNSGIVTSGDHGIFLQGANNAIVNTGVITAYKNNGISLEGANNKITNTGKIINDQGGCGIFIKSDGGGPAFIDNSGVIQGTVGVRLAGSVKLENSGHIGSHDLKGEWAIRSAGAASDSVFIHNAKGGYINGGYSQNGMGEGIKSAFLGSAAAETILNEGAISGDLFFSDGHDLYSGKKGTVFDDVDLGSGNDTAEGGQGADTFKMGVGNDVAHGGGGHDTIFGGDGQDKLAGGEGNDAIDGGTGNDRLEGGLGNDTLKGGAGSDTFILAQEGKGQFDLIADYAAGQDRIRIEGSCFGLGSLAGQMVSSKVFCLGSGATTADQRFLYNAATGILLYDKDGSGAAAAMKIAVFSNKPALAASDFYFI